ncbi:Transcription termination/antitermination protein NusA [Dirofilaria immitis]|nr:Transcription termination/antitermination protein NusA [Dirofilaria immitis]
MLRIITSSTISAFLVNSALAVNDEIQQLREIIETFDKDYKEGNMTRLTSDFKNALEEYGDGFEKEGDNIKAYIQTIRRSDDGHQIILSRAHEGFLEALLDQETSCAKIWHGSVKFFLATHK